MPTLTTRLGLKKPLGTENVTRAAYNENLDIMDANAATKEEVDNKYSKPDNGIPESDLATSVQTSLEKANNAATKVEFMEHKNDLVTDVDGVHGFITEFGEWTPKLEGGNGTNNHVYEYREGSYYRLGKQVICNFRMKITTKDVGMGGIVTISGLPYTPATVLGQSSASFSRLSNIDFVDGYTTLTGFVLSSSARIQLQQYGDNISYTDLYGSSINDNTIIAGTVIYII